MTDQQPQSRSPEDAPPSINEATTSLERYDLTGSRIQQWTVWARDRLAALTQRLFFLGRQAGETTPTGRVESVGETVGKLPGKGLDFVEAHIDKAAVELQLKGAQTEAEFAKRELMRAEKLKVQAETAKLDAETRAQHLENLERQIEIAERLREITSGRTDMQVVSEGNDLRVFFANLPGLTDQSSDDDTACHVNDLGLAPRILQALSLAGIETSDDLCARDRDYLLAIPKLGPKSVDAIELTLSRVGLSLRESDSL